MAMKDQRTTGTTGTTGTSDTQSDSARWDTEREYWRNNYASRPYATGDRSFDYYEPGYRFGYEAANRYRGREWTDAENDLSRDWNTFSQKASAKWEDVKDAARDAWNRVRGNR